MALLSSATVLSLADSMAIVLSQAYQLARARLGSAGSPILRLLAQRDQAFTEVDLPRRELEGFRAQREGLPPHRRPDYRPEERLAIPQLRRLRGWSIQGKITVQTPNRRAEQSAGPLQRMAGRKARPYRDHPPRHYPPRYAFFTSGCSMRTEARSLRIMRPVCRT
jgi:hypothetical protein